VKLTEAKLKQMIAEALKSKNLQDFGIPTPDEKLKADLGSETYGKIQSLDKTQADIMKQSFDSNYPRETSSETLKSFLESYGFKFLPGGINTMYNGVYNTMYFYRNDGSTMETIDFSYKIINDEKGQKIQYDIYFEEAVSDYEFQHRGYIKVPDMFEFDIESEEDAETISSLVLMKERARLEKLVEGEFDHPAI
tara:strand:+ start:442 stop:1023 length:582 start_codon:yes stop_codon:yes gene_type:complete